jgi:dienelactone hydrolase
MAGMGGATMVGTVFALSLCEVSLYVMGAGAGETASIPATAKTPQLAAYVARPTATDSAATSQPAPGVLVLHDCKGYAPHYAKIAEHFASRGYVAVAIDTLAPQHLSSACEDVAGQTRVEAADARVALDWMRTQPYIDGRRLALLGYSMGAEAALEIVDPPQTGGLMGAPQNAAVPSGLQAVVAYYPGCQTFDPKNVRVPILILDGAADDITPSGPCQAFAQAATAAGKAVTITTYPGATHAFNFDAPDRLLFGRPVRYDPDAAYAAGAETITFFHEYLGRTP